MDRETSRRAVEQAAEHTRGVGVTEFLHGQADPWVVLLSGLVSQLGDVWFLFLVGGLLYVTGEYTPRWVLDRRQGMFVLALVVTYIALIGVLKGVLVLPRPSGAVDPGDLWFVPPVLRGVVADITTATGPGFPSGHALGTTMVWGGLALVVDRWSARRRLALAAGVVTVVSLSRLVLGVHYAVDVVVGAAVGLVVVFALYRFSERGTDPGRVLGVAVAVGLLGLVVTVTLDSVAALGAAVGGWLVWRSIAASVTPRPSSRREVVGGLAVFLVAGAVFAAVYVLKPALPVVFVATAAAAGAVVGAPVLNGGLR